MIKRNLQRLSVTLLAAAFTAGGLTLLQFHHQTGAASVLPVAGAALAEAAVQVSVSARESVFSTANGSADDSVLSPEVAGAPRVLLSEPVMILGHNGPTTALAKGTKVALLDQRGAYAQVQYRQKVLTVPRSSVVAGALITSGR